MILQDVFLISEEYIKTNSVMSDNLDMKYVKPCIAKAQVVDLQQLIGTKLAVKICEMVRDHAIEGTDYETLLVDYIQPYLLVETQAEFLVTNYAKQRNAGNVQYIDTNHSNIQIQDVWSLHDHYNHTASFLANRLTDYIYANRKKYPEYCRVSDCSEMHAHQNSETHCGWVLGGKPNKCDHRR